MATNKEEKKSILNWIWVPGAVIALLTQFIMAVWYFAQIDSRLANVEYAQGHIAEKLELNVPVTNKAENDIIKLEKDADQIRYRLEKVETWKDKWTNKAEGLKYMERENNSFWEIAELIEKEVNAAFKIKPQSPCKRWKGKKLGKN